ncbi:MAG: Uncharacterised protein [Crocinitomicaceae bacterium]|nr:MAG: Uncharacterised protein [Crocinitomicaceae bacterium]
MVDPYLISFISSFGGSKLSLNGFKKLAITVGIIIQIKDGIISNFTSCIEETFLPIQSMVVVTSPIGDQAPPALAAMIISPANHILSLLSLINFLRMVINTIVAVRLSIIADKIKANIHMIQSRYIFFFVFIKFFIVANPLKWSMISTMVIAPIKKTNISQVFPK